MNERKLERNMPCYKKIPQSSRSTLSPNQLGKIVLDFGEENFCYDIRSSEVIWRRIGADQSRIQQRIITTISKEAQSKLGSESSAVIIESFAVYIE